MKKIVFLLIFWSIIITGFSQNTDPNLDIHEVKINYDYSQEELGTIFSADENSYLLRLSLFRHPDENAELSIKIWTVSRDNYTLVSGPFRWDISSGPQGWMEYTFPYPIAIYAGRIYLISFENISDNNKNDLSTSSQLKIFDNQRTFSSVSFENDKTIKPTSWFINTSGRIKIQAILNVQFDGGRIGNDQSICYNSKPLELFQIIPPTGGDGTYNYQWQISDNHTTWTNIEGATSETYSPPALTSNRWYRRIVTSGVFGSINSNEILISVYPIFEPGEVGSVQTICYNSVPTALNQIRPPTGGDGVYSFQWQLSTDNVSWTDIPGAVFQSYSPGALTSSRWYRRNVTSKSCGQISSAPVRITVIDELVPGVIGSDQVICYNSRPAGLTQLSPVSGGTGSYTFQWQISNNGTNWTNILGATQSSYAPSSMNSSAYFRRSVSSGNCSNVSNTVLVSVNPDLMPGSVGSPQTICYNTIPAQLTQISAPSGGIGSFSFQWQTSSNNSSWSNITGATLASYAPPALTASTYFRRNVTSGDCGTVSSASVLITVNANLTPGSIGSAQSICYNDVPAPLTQVSPPSGGTGNYTYQWQSSQNNSDWSNISGATLSSYSPQALTANTYFRRNVTSGDCGTVSSNSVLITVNPALVPGSIGNDQTICYNTSPAQLSQLTPPSGGTGSYTYQWQSSSNNATWSDISGATSSAYSPPPLTATTYFRRNVRSGDCNTVNSNPVTITVNPQINPGSVGSPQTICYNTIPAQLTQISAPSGGIGSFSFQWQTSSNNSSWSNITGATLASYAPPALTASTYFRRNVTSGDCGTVSSASVLITVNANLTPGSIGSAQSICYNDVPAPLTLVSPPSGGTGNYTYQWQSSQNNSDWSNISGATLSSYSPQALTANTYFRRNVTSGDCGTVSSNSVLITVNPALVPGSIGNDQTICYNTSPAQLSQLTPPSGGTGSYTYQWQSSSNNATWSDISGATSSAYSPPPLTANRYFRTRVRSGDCYNNTNSILINVYAPVNQAQLHDSKRIYTNTSTTFNVAITGGVPPYTINYTRNGTPQPVVNNYTSGTAISTGILTTGTYNYALTSVTDANGCGAQDLGSSITITVLSDQVMVMNTALVVVNSSSSYYSDYTTYIKPYLDYFGIPYDVCNVASSSLPSFYDYAVIIFGHRNVYTSGYPITQLESAISDGVGLYSFDPHLFDYSSSFTSLISSRSLSSGQITISNYSHYITSYHAPDVYNPNSNIIELENSLSVTQNSNLTGGITLATMSSGSQNVSLLQVAAFGNGKIVKWCSYGWVFDNILGPVYGMDDLIWKGIVWAARKPFVMQGLPPFVTMRVDDTDGSGSGVIENFEWIKICNQYGIIPWVGTFNNEIRPSNIPTLKYLIDNNLATAFPHAFNGDDFIYFNHQNLPSFDPAANVRAARDFYITHGLKFSKYLVPHFYEISSEALSEVRNLGAEFIATHMLPDQFYFASPSTPWINCGPYRINRYGNASGYVPVYYAGYVNLNGIEFFNCLIEITDDGGYEWYPDSDVTSTVARGIRHLRRSFHSMALASLFTHEYFLASISISNWREIISQITSNITEYNPEYRSTDYAIQYLRAKQNIVITSVIENLNDITISYSGNNDMDTRCYLFNESGGQITYRFVTLPRTNGSNEVTVSK